MKALRNFAIVLLSLALLGGGYAVAAHFSGGAYPTFGLPLGGERGLLRRTVESFWEDIQFKDFDKAATYHDPSIQGLVDIPLLLERLFVMKPEALDIVDAEIAFVDVDTTGNRARVKTRIHYNVLLDGSAREQEVMLYFNRKDNESPWFMDLETSLRQVEGDPNKKH